VEPDGRTIANLKVDFSGTCPPSGASSKISIADTGPWSIQPDHTFAIDESSSSSHLKLNGGFSGDAASGSFQLQTTDDAGATKCDTGSLGWSAKLQK